MNPAIYEGFNANEMFGSCEGFDASGNKQKDKWDAFYRNYYLTDKQKEKEERKNNEKKKKDKEENEDNEVLDGSLVYLGLGVATLGAAVIIVMSMRK
jgi:hypothetical protein